MNLEALEAVARKFHEQYPPRDLLVRIIAPVGWTKRASLALGLRAGYTADSPASALYGVPIVEDPGMAADATPLGEFADGSIRPLSLAPEEGATR